MPSSKTHWRKFDYRKESLTQIVKGIDRSLIILKERQETVEWYDALFYRDDAEPIWGLAFIAFQNYINGSIYDLYENISEKTKYYKMESTYKSFKGSYIELIIGLANFIKHKDDEQSLHKGTKEILKSFNLSYQKNAEESPIFDGLTILTENWNIYEILKSVIDWRAKLFDEFEKHNLKQQGMV